MIDPTTVCLCLHPYVAHNENQDADCMLCGCSRFNTGSRRSRRRYQRGERTVNKRVARVSPGDVLLVAFSPDGELRPAVQKTGALLVRVVERQVKPGRESGFRGHRSPPRHVIYTDLGHLPPLKGANTVTVLDPAVTIWR